MQFINSQKNDLKIAIELAMFLSISIILQIFESLFPLPLFIPGIKLGLANIVTVVLLYKYGFKESLEVNILKVFMASLIRTGFGINFLFSIIGSILSVCMMNIFLRKSKLSIVGISIVGANFHIIGQLIIATIIYKTELFLVSYLPYMLIISIFTGLLIGHLSNKVLDIVK